MSATDTFGIRVRQLRTANRLTLDQLAEMTGSSKSYIWEIESGKESARPSAMKAYRIASALRVTIEYLLGVDDCKSTASDEAFINHVYLKADENIKRQVRQIADVLINTKR
ncbi:helix-turn-helix transcriptional regulator [uncultured Paraglaciecola sp.]|uniref:helix-turn-helix domain-containing protein n=1 Tax=uncultured Paraglaciecola sp. TaxID=1765024 RepID=UPI00260CBE96|nr:helix-turn-helix transcriptional regulator [uncultured Paraglaciecola sp.]